jgi:hypothetical protein
VLAVTARDVDIPMKDCNFDVGIRVRGRFATMRVGIPVTYMYLTIDIALVTGYSRASGRFAT